MDVKVNRSKELYHGRVFTLLRENITLPNQVSVDIDILRHPGAAAIVAVSDNGKVLLIHQYRHAVRELIWEIPAGTLDPEETHATCASRELTEETGYVAANFKFLGKLVPVPGYSNERISLFLATHLSPARQSLDKDEYLKVYQVPFDEAINMIYKGDIQDAKTITGLLLAQRVLNLQIERKNSR